MTVLSETRERFVRAILAQVPADRIAEVHFFQPIKQGGVETGVAVVAAWPESEPAEPTVVADPAGPEALAEFEPEFEPEPESEPEVDADDLLEEEATAELEQSVVSDEPSSDDQSPERELRPIVYAARYRLTLKGPDRGKWETNVVAEAEAPLVTVEAVVRGVQRRAGDAEDPVRMTGEELRASVHQPQHPAA